MPFLLIIPEEKESMVDEILEHKPETWEKYKHEKDGLFSIIHMEYEELMRIKDSRPHKEVVIALAHLAAAATNALNKMTC